MDRTTLVRVANSIRAGTLGVVVIVGFSLAILFPVVYINIVSSAENIGSIGTVLSIYVQLIALIIAVGAALPYIIKLFLYYYLNPRIYILSPENLTINCLDVSKRMQLQFEVSFLKPRGNIFDIIENLEESGLINDIDNYPGSIITIKGNEITAIPGTILGFGCQLEPPTTTRIRLYPSIHLSEFGFPTFYGNVELKPIDRTFVIDSDGDLSESDKEWAERKYGIPEIP